MTYLSDLKAYLSAREDAMVELLGRLVRAESPSVVPDAQRGVQALLTEALEELDFVVHHLPGRGRSGGHLYARPRQRRRHHPAQLLLGHSDTVWPLGTLARMPFSVEGRIVRGPGVFDMKAGLAQMVFALRALRALHLTPPLTPVVFVNSDEEINSIESMPHLLRLARRVQRTYVLEPALGPEGRLKTARKGTGHYTVRVTGRSAHAGLAPERGASAILALAHLIVHLHGLSDPASGITINVGRIRGGTRANVVAAESEAEVDVRVSTRADAQRLDALIRALETTVPGTRVSVEGEMDRPPMERTPRNRALWAAARETAAALGLDVREAAAGGASDGNLTSLYTATLDGLGAVGDGAHADHEHIQLDRLVERTVLLAALLMMPPTPPAPAEARPAGHATSVARTA
ncbi:carboxypeptidase [Rhodothermaceae bacterium RA]|nr:carboxypeptidase [Rhodothermaceae bacterium RA]